MSETELHRTIAAEVGKSYRSPRKASDYCSYFSYQHGYFRGKLILDVGAGDSTFAGFVRHSGGRVVSIDPDYRSNPPKDPTDCVAAVAQFLPFKDEVFDETVASWSLCWVYTGLENALRETGRVTKKGGSIKIFPVMLNPHTSLSTHFTKDVILNTDTGNYGITINKGEKFGELVKDVLDCFAFRFPKQNGRPLEDPPVDQKRVNRRFYDLLSLQLNLE